MISKRVNLTRNLFLLAIIFSLWLLPSVTPVLGIGMLLFSLAIAISSIFKKHKQSKNPRPKIAKDILILVATLLLIIFLGGLAGMFANQFASPRFGAVVGFVSAIAVSFALALSLSKGGIFCEMGNRKVEQAVNP